MCHIYTSQSPFQIIGVEDLFFSLLIPPPSDPTFFLHYKSYTDEHIDRRPLEELAAHFTKSRLVVSPTNT